MYPKLESLHDLTKTKPIEVESSAIQSSNICQICRDSFEGVYLERKYVIKCIFREEICREEIIRSYVS